MREKSIFELQFIKLSLDFTTFDLSVECKDPKVATLSNPINLTKN